MAKTVHGMCFTRLYHIWNSMKQRCQNPKAISYKYYGKKGVTVCEEWNKSFKTFYDWAVQNGYQENLTIDRIDSNGNYEPLNCRWATNKKQQNNTSYNRLITYGDKTYNATQWSEILGLPRTTIYNRIRRGWSDDKIISQAKKNYKNIGGNNNGI